MQQISSYYDENVWVLRWTFKSLRDLNWRWQKSQLKATFMCILSICFLIFVVLGDPYPHSMQFQSLIPLVSVWNIFSFTSASKPFRKHYNAYKYISKGWLIMFSKHVLLQRVSARAWSSTNLAVIRTGNVFGLNMTKCVCFLFVTVGTQSAGPDKLIILVSNWLHFREHFSINF